MKSLRLMMLAAALVLSGCSTLSNMHWSSLSPMNWFSASLEVNEQGVGGLNAGTPMNEEAVSEGLNDNYRLRNGMKIDRGTVVRYFEAMDDKTVKVLVNGENGTVSRVEVMDKKIETGSGVAVGTAFSDLYAKAYGACTKGLGDDAESVECKAPDSQHISYLFSGEWRGPQGLIPADETLKKWTVSKIIWRK